jgi:hypothetical protein
MYFRKVIRLILGVPVELPNRSLGMDGKRRGQLFMMRVRRNPKFGASGYVTPLVFFTISPMLTVINPPIKMCHIDTAWHVDI